MSSGVISMLVTGLMPLLGAGLGASTTLLVQRSSARQAKLEFLAESRLAHREELKSAIIDYFEATQRVQGELDVRERGGTPDDLKRLIESVNRLEVYSARPGPIRPIGDPCSSKVSRAAMVSGVDRGECLGKCAARGTR